MSKPIKITMPAQSPTMTEGKVGAWKKKEGDLIKPGDVILEIETDKSTAEVEAVDGGYLRKIVVPTGEMRQVNDVLAVLTATKDENIDAFLQELVKAPEVPKAAEKTAVVEKSAEAKPAATSVGGGLAMPAFAPMPPLNTFHGGGEEDRVFASPLAKKIAKEKNIDISTVKGSGPRGRVVEADLQNVQPNGVVGFGHKTYPSVQIGSFREEPLSSMRKLIGKRLQESKTFIPHFYITQEVRVCKLDDARNQLKEIDIKVSFNDFVVRAVALALREHPKVNSGMNTVNQSITYYNTIDIAIAVSIDEGLITPIVRCADRKNVTEISKEIKVLAGKAKKGQLQPQEYQGGSFTVSNLGMFGISSFAGIINPPQAAILSVGAIEEKAVIEKGTVVPGKTMTMTLSADHRVIDGADGAKFIKTVQKYLENPTLLFLE